MQDPQAQVVISISPQARASLGVVLGLPPAAALRRLVGCLRHLGAARVLDTTAVRDVTLQEAQHEFVERYRAVREGRPPPPGEAAAAAAPHRALAAADGGPAPAAAPLPLPSPPPSLLPLPLLASSCPGWVCYAEKTHGALVIPHMSAVKSPQQAAGTLLKVSQGGGGGGRGHCLSVGYG